MFNLVARIMAAYRVILVWGKTSIHISINQVKPVAEMSSRTRMVTLSAIHSILLRRIKCQHQLKQNCFITWKRWLGRVSKTF